MKRTTLRALSLNQFQELTGSSYRTVKSRLAKLTPVGEDGRSRLYDPQAALPLIFDQAAENPVKEKARLDRLRADKVELELEVLNAELVPTPEITDAWARIAVEIRTRMLAIPTKVAPLVFRAKRLTQVKKVIENSIHDALTSLADGGAAVPRKAPATKKADSKRVGRRKPEAKPRKQRRAG